MTREDFIRAQAEARGFLWQLSKLCPGAFDANGKPLVAELRFPRLPNDKQQPTGESA